MAHCENCGTKLDHGACPNCHEELVIEMNQGEFVGSRPDWWRERVAEQEDEARTNRRKERKNTQQ